MAQKEGTKMRNYTTESFEKGSEFRVHTVTWVESKRGRDGLAPMTWDSEIFSTYEEAKELASTLDSRTISIMVRRPGNKNFKRDYQTKTV